ncbi:MAG: hypothetical protein SFX73_34775 [Kofleriaceae bacterium]|nr:hypothetical protein [Kofleriaceae bacterium]
MPVEVPISNGNIRRAFLRAVDPTPQGRGHFVTGLRATLLDAFGTAMTDAGIATPSCEVRPQLSRARAVDSSSPIQHRSGCRWELQSLDAAFCAGYGIDDYSASAINYLCGTHAKLPSLRAFLEIDRFSAGNILVALPPGSGEVCFVPSAPMRIVGHITDTGPRKRKPYVVALGVHFENSGLRDLLGDAVQLVEHATCDIAWLDEVVVDCLRFPIFYLCRYCGRLHTCECFRAHIDRDEHRRHLSGRSELSERLESLEFVAGLCHLCRGGVPRHSYGHPMYYSSFGQRYLPYIELFARRAGARADADRRAAENEARTQFGFPAIGERWTSETVLFRVVEALVAPREVIHHYRGKELEGLELDVWIPELKVGIEYQGEQHYAAIKHWGGDEGLAKRQSNDRRKRALCKRLGFTLIEFRFDEELTEAAVFSRLKRHLPSSVPT